MTDENAERDRRAYQAKIMALPSAVIAEQFGLTVADVNKIVDDRMPRVTNEFRARSFALDLERLETLTRRCLEQVSKGSMAAGHLLLKTLERRSAMLGLDSPLKVDLAQISAPRESSTEELERILNRLQGKPEADPPQLN
jgi:hypothetical protein